MDAADTAAIAYACPDEPVMRFPAWRNSRELSKPAPSNVDHRRPTALHCHIISYVTPVGG